MKEQGFEDAIEEITVEQPARGCEGAPAGCDGRISCRLGRHLLLCSYAVLLDSLNSTQLDAVEHTKGLSSPRRCGSGKTRVLTHRVAYLLDQGLAAPEEVLAATFTNKAAREMKDRVALLVGPDSRRMWVSTFHAFCARILRVHAEKLGYKGSSQSTTAPTRSVSSSAASWSWQGPQALQPALFPGDQLRQERPYGPG